METSRKVAIIKSNLKDTIRWYLKLTQPLHKIKNQGIEVLAAILYLYHISEEESEIDKWADVFSYENRIKMRTMLDDMSEATFNNHLSLLRKKGALKKSNMVVPSFNPAITKDSERFEVILRFEMKK